MEVNPIELTEETVSIYEEALNTARYEDEFFATCKGRMVTLVNPDENSRYRYYARAVDGRYLSMMNTTAEAIKFLMTGEYFDCWKGTNEVWDK